MYLNKIHKTFPLLLNFVVKASRLHILSLDMNYHNFIGTFSHKVPFCGLIRREKKGKEGSTLVRIKGHTFKVTMGRPNFSGF